MSLLYAAHTERDDQEEEQEQERGRRRTRQSRELGALLGLWHLFTICRNQVRRLTIPAYLHRSRLSMLTAVCSFNFPEHEISGSTSQGFPYPMNVTTLQFAVGTVVALLIWTTGILKRPKLYVAQLPAILLVVFVRTMANLFTNISPGKVAVSFTHINKAHLELKPSFLVLLSRDDLLRQLLIAWVGLCLVLIVTFQSRNVLRVRSLGAINLFSVVTVMSFLLLAPVTFLTEGVKVTPAALQSMGLNIKQIFK